MAATPGPKAQRISPRRHGALLASILCLLAALPACVGGSTAPPGGGVAFDIGGGGGDSLVLPDNIGGGTTDVQTDTAAGTDATVEPDSLSGSDDAETVDTAIEPDAPADVNPTCKPTIPPTEACDGIDNDCNGKTDDGACDDNNPCTDQQCDGSRAAQGLDGCTYALSVGAACDDGSACTANDTCSGGVCQSGKGKDCNDSNSCTIDKCKAATGACENSYIGDGKFCNDGLGCTNDDKCTATGCKGKVNTSCDDGIPCTQDTCDAQGACQHQQVSAGPCEDGNPCTTEDKCFQGICTPGNLSICDDDKPCTDDYCDASKGGCIHAPKLAGTSCSQGLCATGGGCDASGICIGLKVLCDDGKKCTVDDCNPQTGACNNIANPAGTPCDDGEACTLGETCDAGGDCKAPAGQKGCNDGNPCTQDLCDLGTQACTYKQIIGACDDGNGCTAGEVCVGGGCKIGPSPEVITILGNGTAKYTEGKGAEGQVADPRGMAMTVNGLILMADSQNHRIRRVKSEGYSDTFSGIGQAGFQDGNSFIVRYLNPTDVAISLAGTALPPGAVVVADKGNHRIRLVQGDGAASTLAGSGVAGFLDGASANARFQSPEGVALDTKDQVFVADTGNHRIRRITAGQVVTLFGDGTAAFADGAGGQARLNLPTDIAVGPLGAFFVADSGNHRVRRFVGDLLETFAGSGKAGWADGTALKAELNQPTALFHDQQGRLLLVEHGNHTLRAVSGGLVETLAGVGQAGFLDGPGSKAQLSKPTGVVADKEGKVYFADSGNHRVRTAAPSLKICFDGNPCTLDSCDKGSGACMFDALKNGDACDDGSACTVGDACDFAGQCKGSGKSCDDGSSCTEDGCNAITGLCEHKATQKPCDDGDACTTGDNCVAGACVSGVGDVSSLAGNGNPGSTDGGGANATFYAPEDVAIDPAGTAYIADTTQSRLRKLTADGVVSTLVGAAGAGFQDGPGNAAKLNQPSGVAVDNKGNIFVCDRGNNRIRKVLADGATSTLAGDGSAAFADGKGTSARFSAPQGIAVDPLGNVYVADANNHRVRRIDADGVVTTIAGSGTAGYLDGPGAAARFYTPYDVVFSPLGEVMVADYNNHRVRRIGASGVVGTLAGSGTSGTTDGIGDKAQLSGPSGVAFDANGNLLLVERISHRVRRISATGEVVTVSGSTVGFAEGKPADAKYSMPSGIEAAPDGSVLIADRNNHRIRKLATTKVVCSDGVACTLDACNKGTGKCSFAPIGVGGACNDGNACTVGEVCGSSGACAGGKAKACSDGNDCSIDSCNIFSGECVFSPTDGLCSDGMFCTVNDRCTNGSCVGDARDVFTLAGQAVAGVQDGKGANAKFNVPQGIDVDAAGNVWTTDFSGQSIRKITPKGVVVTVAGDATAGFVDGKGFLARFNTPSGVAADASGGAYVADRGNHRIRAIKSDGTVSTFAGSGSATFQDGTGAAASFYYPEGITFHAGTVFVADTYNHRIRTIDSQAKVLNLAGSGGATWKDGKGAAASFYYPRGLDADNKGNLYVADSTNHRIRRIEPDGTVTTVAGSGQPSFADGKAAVASFSTPYGVAVGSDGSLWVADTNNHRLRLIDVQGNVSTIAGGQAGFLDEAANLALFNTPRGIAIDSKQAVYVTDGTNHSIRKLASPFNDCSDGSECSLDACDEAKDVCTATKVADGSACIDGKPCLSNRICNQGTCVGGVPKNCDDSNVCTLDSCDALSGDCLYKANTSIGCAPMRRVFVTSQVFDAAMGGPSGPTARCQQAAAAAKLGGVWQAWMSHYLSNAWVTPTTSFSKSAVPYRRLDGALVALHFNDLIDGKLDNAIDVTENGDKVSPTASSASAACGSALPAVWTGTAAVGTQYDANTTSIYYCAYWTTNTTSTSYRLGVGRATATDANWSLACSDQKCAQKAHLYCFEQTDSWGQF